MGRWLITLWMTGALPVLGAGMTEPKVDFSADVTIESAGQKVAGKLYVGGGKQRMEMSRQGHTMAFVSSRADKRFFTLMVEQKMAMEYPAGMDDRAAGAPRSPLDEKVDLVADGTETVDGRACTRYRVVRKDKPKAETKAWVTTKENIPIKIEGVDEAGRSLRWALSNLAIGPQAASLFEIPADFRRMSMGGGQVDPEMMKRMQEQKQR